MSANAACQFEGVPADVTRKNIPLEEARSLVAYPICQPSYLPDNIDADPEVTYHTEMGDPKDADISLRYYRSDSTTPVLELRQEDSSTDLERYYRSHDGHEVAINGLVGWLTDGQDNGEMLSQVTVNTTGYEDKHKRWVSEITSPNESKSSVIQWTDGNKLYSMYSRLALDEAKQVAQSIPDCGHKP
jgi:hypothetical protein